MKRRSWLYLIGGLGVLGLGYQAGRSTGSRKVDPAPLIVEQLQALGELKTQRMTVSRVFTTDSKRELEGVWGQIPPVRLISDWASHNDGLFEARATIEATIDLRQAKVYRDGETVVVQLPPADLSVPNVSTKIHAWKAGAFWRDLDLPAQAETMMSQWTRDAAEQKQIRAKASEEAKMVLREFLDKSGISEQRVRISI